MNNNNDMLDKEIMAVAAASQLNLKPNEIPPLTSQVTQLLEYASCVCTYEGKEMHALRKNSNVVREDVIQKCAVQGIYAQAPLMEGSYFVVPIVLDNR